MKYMPNLADKFVPGITLFMQIIMSFLYFDWQLVLEHTCREA